MAFRFAVVPLQISISKMNGSLFRETDKWFPRNCEGEDRHPRQPDGKAA